MDVSIFLAKAFSIYFLVMGVTMIVRRKKMQEVIDAFFANTMFHEVAHGLGVRGAGPGLHSGQQGHRLEEKS